MLLKNHDKIYCEREQIVCVTRQKQRRTTEIKRES